MEPRLFISYSWSTPDHDQWVIDLATQLRESGVDVVLDKWDLKEGHDSISFMEKMVTDPQIKKVLMVSDKVYADKADGRLGGVGTETQIISREVYERQDQEKFVAVIPVRGDDGKPFLPTYYKGRIYIDLSEADRYSENFEKLLRWIFNKPLHVKPELGKAPAFLDSEAGISLGTSSAQRRALDAIKNGKPYAIGALDEYLDVFSQNLVKFRINLDGTTDKFDETIIESIEKFTPYRNELIQVVIAISQYMPRSEVIQKIHRFIEKIIPYMHRSGDISHWNKLQFDNFKFIVHEIYLYIVAVLVRDGHFSLAAELISTPYFIDKGGDYFEGKAASFTEIRTYAESFRIRGQRMQRLSARADLLKQRAETADVKFSQIMQADFILFMRAEIEENGRWWPESLMYSSNAYGPFEIFSRSQSKTYFDKVKVLLGIDAPGDLKFLLDSYDSDRSRLPTWEFERLNPYILIGYEKLCSRP